MNLKEESLKLHSLNKGKLEIKSKDTFRNNYLNLAIKQGLVNLTIPDKPTSKNQMYYKN